MRKIRNRSVLDPKGVPNYNKIWGFYIVLPLIALSIIGNLLEKENYIFIFLFASLIIFPLVIIPRLIKKHNNSNYSILFGFGLLLLIFLFEYNVLMYFYLQTLDIDKIYFILVLMSEIIVAIVCSLYIHRQIYDDSQSSKKRFVAILLLNIFILIVIIVPVLFIKHDAQYFFTLFGILYASIIYLITKMIIKAIIFKKMKI